MDESSDWRSKEEDKYDAQDNVLSAYYVLSTNPHRLTFFFLLYFILFKLELKSFLVAFTIKF